MDVSELLTSLGARYSDGILDPKMRYVAHQIYFIMVQLNTFNNTETPLFCPVCFYKIAQDLKELPEIAIAAMRSSQHKFWSACVEHILTPRTASDWAALELQLDKNIKECRSRESHQDIHRVIKNSFLLFVDGLCRVIMVTCRVGSGLPDQWRKKPPTLKQNVRDECWPTSVDQLFPFGTREGVRMLVSWIKLFPSLSPATMLIQYFYAARSSLLPHLQEEPVRSTFMCAILHMLQDDPWARVVDWPDEEPEGIPGAPRQVTDWPEPAIHQSAAIIIMGCLLYGPESRQVLSNMSRGYEKAILAAVQRALIQLPDAGAEFQTLSVWGKYAQQRLLLPEEVLDPRVQSWILRRTAEQSSRGDLSASVRATLASRLESRQCGNMACKILDGNGGVARTFGFCARCRGIRYCSSECQHDDWKRGTACSYPWAQDCRIRHRLVCPILARVLAATNTKMGKLEFASAFDALALTGTEQLVLADWVIACRVVSPENALKLTGFGPALGTMPLSKLYELIDWLGIGEDEEKKNRLPSFDVEMFATAEWAEKATAHLR